MSIKYLYKIIFNNPNDDQTYFYYGVQYGIKSNPENLGRSYFSSSNKIKKLIKMFGLEYFQFDVKHIFKSETTIPQIIDHEYKLILKCKNKYSILCLNERRKGTIPPVRSGVHNANYGNKKTIGVRLLHNPETQEQSRLYPEQIQEYLDKGWIYGANLETKKIHKEKAIKANSFQYIDPRKNPELSIKSKETLRRKWANGEYEYLLEEMRNRKPMLGRKQTDNQKKVVSEKLSKRWKIILPNKEEIEITNLRQYCIENKLDQGNMMAVAAGRLKQYKKYLCVRLDD